jgi:hypothetical protein
MPFSVENTLAGDRILDDKKQSEDTVFACCLVAQIKSKLTDLTEQKLTPVIN